MSGERLDVLGAFRFVYDTETDYNQYYKETPKLRHAWYDDENKIEYDFFSALKPYLRKAFPEAPLNQSHLDETQIWKILHFDNVLFQDCLAFQPEEFLHKPVSDERFEKNESLCKMPGEMILSNGLLVDYKIITPFDEYNAPMGMSDYVINFNSLSYQEYPPVFIVIERYNQSLSAAENYRPEEGFLLECLDSLFNIKQLDCYYTALIKGKRDKIDELKEEAERRRRQAEAGISKDRVREAKDTILQEILCWYYNDWEPFKTLYIDNNTLEDRDLLLQRLMEAKPEIDVALAQPRPWKEISIIPKTPERRVNYADIEGDTGQGVFLCKGKQSAQEEKGIRQAAGTGA